MTERRRLPLIPAEKVKPKKSSVLQMDPKMDGPLLKGEAAADIEWLCGSCDHVLTTGLEPGQVGNIVIRCICGAYNDASI